LVAAGFATALERCEVQTPRRSGADQRRAAHQHVADRAGAITPGPQILDNVFMGQATLIDYLYYCGVIRVLPDGPKILARSPHFVTLPCVQMNEPF
jgi:hypothetical protein